MFTKCTQKATVNKVRCSTHVTRRSVGLFSLLLCYIWVYIKKRKYHMNSIVHWIASSILHWIARSITNVSFLDSSTASYQLH